MADLLLIHGASHGAWCWTKIVPRLEALGHDARAIDLPAAGVDPTPPETVTMRDYVRACVGALGEDTIVVGHSLGGLTITLAAASAPQRVRSLVYLAAFVPPPGQRFAELRADAISAGLREAASVDRNRRVSTPLRDRAPAVYYHDCHPGDVDFALSRLTPQPLSILTEALDFDPPAIPRHYIACTDDRAVRPDYQRAISAGWPAGTVHEISAGHSPFFSDPDRLVQILDRIATS